MHKIKIIMKKKKFIKKKNKHKTNTTTTNKTLITGKTFTVEERNKTYLFITSKL